MTNKNYTVKYKRKGKTSYKNRLKLLSSRKTRLVIRKSNTGITVQFVSFNPKGDYVIIGANSKELVKLGYKNNRGNIPSSYLTGLLAGKKAKSKNIKEAILDLGLQRKSNRLYSALKGVLDAGVDVPHSEKVIPNKQMLQGENIKLYNKKYLPENFQEIKNKIIKE